MSASSRITVLVVDDEPTICWGFERLLSEQGYRVLVAASAEAGLRLAQEHRLALVLLDVRLPGESGLSALPRFREVTGGAPIIVMTAFGDLETAVTAVRQGASDYLIKPFALAAAAEACSRALRRAEPQAAESAAAGFTANRPRSRPEGLGLGLPLVARSAEFLGGTVQWHRRSDQTVFCLRIPAAS